MTTTKPSIFISYSRQDAELKDRLVQHLRVYEREELLTVWDDRQIRAGQDWDPEIESAIRQARMAVLLVSSDFLVSTFIRDREVPLILERRRQGDLVVVPVIVKDCNWQDVRWLSGIQACPPGKPLFGFKDNDQEAALTTVAREIKELLQLEIPLQPTSPLPALSRLVEIRAAVHQLPAYPLDFIGREDDLKALKAAIRQGKTTAIFGVRGLGGVGKTTLALKLAHEIAPLYPDGQIFLDLLGVTTPLSAAEAMAHIIRSFHPDVRPPASEIEITSLYRSVLHGKRVLLLMDNAAGREQIQPLLPPEGSALLVTSRSRFALPGLAESNLNELPREDSCELLLRICARIGGHAEELAAVCGDLPLALRVAASTLQERRTLSPESYLQRLSAGRELLEPVEAMLSLSYELLSSELRPRWCQLAVFPDTFDQRAAAAIWAVEPEAGEVILGDLERSSLLIWEEASRRYRLHDLVRSFVEKRLETAERRSLQEKHSHYYLGVLALARKFYLKGDKDLSDGLNLFDLEWRNIQTGQQFAAIESTQSDTGARLCSAYPTAGAYHLPLRLAPGEQILWLEAALAAAQHLGQRAEEGWHLGNLGNAHTMLQEPRRALEFYEQQLAVTRETGDRQSEGNALNNMGLAYAALDNHHRAIELYEQRLVISREIFDRRGEGTSLSNLGLAYDALGERERGIELYEQHLAIAREIGDRRGEGYALRNLGNAFAKTPKSITLYEQYLSITREIGDRREEGNALNHLGFGYANLGEHRLAAEFYEKGLAIRRELGDRRGESTALGNLGSAYLALGETSRAIESVEQSLTITRTIGDRQGEARSSWILGLLHLREDPARTVELMQTIEDSQRKVGLPLPESCAVLLKAARIRIRLHRIRDAILWWRRR